MPLEIRGSHRRYFATQTLHRIIHSDQSMSPYGIIDAGMDRNHGYVTLKRSLFNGEECNLNGEPLVVNALQLTKPGDMVSYVSSNGRLRFTIRHY